MRNLTFLLLCGVLLASAGSASPAAAQKALADSREDSDQLAIGFAQRSGSGGSRGSSGSSGSSGGSRSSAGGSQSSGGRAQPSGGGSRASGGSRSSGGGSVAPSSGGRSSAPSRSSAGHGRSEPAPSRPSAAPTSTRPSSTRGDDRGTSRTYESPRSSGSSSGVPGSSSGAPTRPDESGRSSHALPRGEGSAPAARTSSGSPTAPTPGVLDLRPTSAPRVRFPAPYRPAGADRGSSRGLSGGASGTLDLPLTPAPIGTRAGGTQAGPPRSGDEGFGGASDRNDLPGPATIRRGRTAGPIELAGNPAPQPTAGPGTGRGGTSGPRVSPRTGSGSGAGPESGSGGIGGGRSIGTRYAEGPIARTRPRSAGPDPTGPKGPTEPTGPGVAAGGRGPGRGTQGRPSGLEPHGGVAPRPDNGHDHDDDHGHDHGHDDGHGWYGYGGCYPWGFGYYDDHFSFAWSFGYSGCHYAWWYWPYYVSCWYPIWYVGYYQPAYGTVVYENTVIYEDADPEVVYVEREAPADLAVGEAVVSAPAAQTSTSPTLPESLHIAAQRYLDLGDQAFRDARFGDAVQLYAKAVALAPEEGALHLVLADALFSTGDYHYAAYSIRRAFELEPALAETSVDKHAFYADPSVFDAQLARLESHCAQHPEDADARLVLATNQLFGRRPAAAVDLLTAARGPSTALVTDPAAEIVLAAARKAQHGTSAPAAPPPAVEGEQKDQAPAEPR